MAKKENTKKVEEVVAEQPAVEETPVDVSAPVSNEVEGKNYKWYIVSSSSGKENSTAKLIKQRVKANNLETSIVDVVVPMQEKIIIQRGKKKTIQDRIYQGYIFIKMEVNDDTMQLIKNTEGVKGFLGMSAKSKLPTPLNEKDLNFTQVKSEATYKSKFSQGDVVKVISGTWKEFIGTVLSVNEEKGKLKVLLSLFNRDTPVDNVDFLEVEKLSDAE